MIEPELVLITPLTNKVKCDIIKISENRFAVFAAPLTR